MISNFWLLTGADSFRLQERVRFFRNAFRLKYQAGIIEDYDLSTAWNVLEGAVLTPNLFGEKRLIFLTNFWNPENFEKATKLDFFNRLAGQSETVTVIALEPTLDKRTKATKFFQKEAQLEKFELLAGMDLEQYLLKWAEKEKITLDLRTTQFLVGRLGVDLWRLTSEIKKLSLLADGSAIDTTMVEANTIPNAQVVLWDFLADVSKKRTQPALRKLRDLLERGESIYQILAMLNREIRIHAQLKWGSDQRFSENTIAQKTKLHPFVVKKTLPLSRNFGWSDLKLLYSELQQIDISIKTGKYQMSTDDPTELVLAVERLIVSIKK